MRSATNSTPGNAPQRPRRSVPVVLATLFGAGRVPFAPGTCGALLGVPVAIALRLAAFHPVLEAGILLGLMLGAVAVSAQAQKALGRPDPPEIVLDEFVSIPVTFFLVPLVWYWWVIGFGLHRVLDVLKPPPIRQLQRLPSGWGIVADDVAAAIVANAVLQLLTRLIV